MDDPTRLRRALAWRAGDLRSRLHRRSFGAFGSGSVTVRPHILRGVDRVEVGARCAIYDGVWLQCEGEDARIVIGDDCYLGHRVHVHASAPITIGERCWIVDDVYVGSADHDRADRQVVVASPPITIGSDVFLGQRVTVLGGVTIGDGATIGAHAVVTPDVPAGATAVGVPARVLPEQP